MKPFDPAPSYQLVADTLRQEIAQGLYKDERLPTQEALADRFDVSRVTIQRALTDLRNDGIIYSMKGKGIFVTPTDQPPPDMIDRVRADINHPSGPVIYCHFSKASSVYRLIETLHIEDPKLKPIELRALVDSYKDEDLELIGQRTVPGLYVELRNYWENMQAVVRLTTGEVAISLGEDENIWQAETVAWLEPVRGIQDNLLRWFENEWNQGKHVSKVTNL